MVSFAWGLLLLAVIGHAGASLQAPASPQHRSQTSELADVLLRAVELMDHGLQDFLKEQPADAPEDAVQLKTNQQKAMKVIHQITTNFHDLKEVVEKFKHRHEAEVKGVEKKVVEEKESTQKCESQCTNDKMQLMKRSEQCEFVLKRLSPPTGSGNESFSVENWRELDSKAEEGIGHLKAENTMLSQKVAELSGRTHDAERRMQDAEARTQELERQSTTLQQQNGQLKADDESMLKTVKQLVQKNKVQAADLQAKALQQAREEMQEEFAKKEDVLKQETEKEKEEAAKYRKQMEAMQKKMQGMQKDHDVLSGDKVHLLGALNSALRQNDEFGQRLKMCSLGNATGSIPGLTDSGSLSSSTPGSMPTYVMAGKAPQAEQAASEAVAAAAETPMPEVKAASFTQTDHHALNHWLNSHAPAPLQQVPVRKSLISSGGADSGDGDVLQQLQLLSLGWQNHRVKADTIDA